jgi:hypothetical protein
MNCPALWEPQLLERPSGLPFDQDSEPTIDTGANCYSLGQCRRRLPCRDTRSLADQPLRAAGARDQTDRDRARSRLKL